MLLSAHSGLRYLVLLLGVIVIAYAAYGLATKRPYDARMRLLATAFTGALDLTALLGVAHLFTTTFYPQLAGHLTMMILAVVVSHMVSIVQRRRALEQRTYGPHVVGTLVVLAIISFGILSIGRPIVG
jgi:ABC-type transport system involved in cytochrome c biogenesis permease subunit